MRNPIMKSIFLVDETDLMDFSGILVTDIDRDIPLSLATSQTFYLSNDLKMSCKFHPL